MVGITLTPEQIRSAPLDVRRWIERELAASLGLRPGEVSAAQPQPETFGGMHIGGSSGGFVLDRGHVSSRQCILRTRAARRKCRKRRARSVPAGRYLAAHAASEYEPGDRLSGHHQSGCAPGQGRSGCNSLCARQPWRLYRRGSDTAECVTPLAPSHWWTRVLWGEARPEQ
jgi:hypothetical protein